MKLPSMQFSRRDLGSFSDYIPDWNSIWETGVRPVLALQTHEPRNRERESPVSFSLSLPLCVCVCVWVVRVLCACVEYGRFLRKIKVGRKSFIACLPHRNCCIKRPWTKNRCRPSVVVPPVTSLPRGSARITDVFAAPAPKHFFRQVDGPRENRLLFSLSK